ncbi:MAG: hypothetical protein ACYDC7_06700 [Acidithiobacillus ferrivorans]
MQSSYSFVIRVRVNHLEIIFEYAGIMPTSLARNKILTLWGAAGASRQNPARQKLLVPIQAAGLPV